MHAHIYTSPRTHACIHTCIRTHIYTRAHTYTHIYPPPPHTHTTPHTTYMVAGAHGCGFAASLPRDSDYRIHRAGSPERTEGTGWGENSPRLGASRAEISEFTKGHQAGRFCQVMTRVGRGLRRGRKAGKDSVYAVWVPVGSEGLGREAHPAEK